MTDESTLATQPAREAQEPVADLMDQHLAAIAIASSYGGDEGWDWLRRYEAGDAECIAQAQAFDGRSFSPPDAAATIERLTGLLGRCRTVLGNMARENEGATFFRWPINHEPLRADAKNLLPLIDEEIGYDA